MKIIDGTYVSAKIFADTAEDYALAQIRQLCSLEAFAGCKIRVMPDVHPGKVGTIGFTATAGSKLLPNVVGIDIGCGITLAKLKQKKAEFQKLDTVIRENIPSGFQIRKKAHRFSGEARLEDLKCRRHIHMEKALLSLGTLGGGNHFIEIDKDDEGFLYAAIHSGSRHLGKKICDYFHKKAKELNQMWRSEVKEEYQLSFLPTQSKEGRQYINWMGLALDYAFENRARMLEQTCAIVKEVVERHTGQGVEFGEEINCHHNYAALENHYGENVWVHRKGATRVREGELAVIPGAMGSYSYVVEGKGSEESFCSSSHGAGRSYSRTGAIKAFSVEQVMVDLKEQGIILGKRKKNDVAEECRFAYKDIDGVMSQQLDLVTPVRKLKTVGVVKG